VNAVAGLANAVMRFGKYRGRLLGDLPAAVLVWSSRQGFPGGKPGKLDKLGELLESAPCVKSNGLENLLRPWRIGG